MEIISVGAETGPHTPRMRSFVQRCDSRLVSDRGLFQRALDKLTGTIIHLGQYSRKHDSVFWFCGHALDFTTETPEDHFRLRKPAIRDLQFLLRLMQKHSPNRHVLFLTDYQFGPKKPRVKRLRTIGELVRLNSKGRLRFNTLYHIKARMPDLQLGKAQQVARANAHSRHAACYGNEN